MPPDPALLDRFRAPLGAIDAATQPVGIAVSGGPDSLALLLLAHAAWPDRVRAATVDHRLRAESAAEARFVATLCAERGIPHAILAPATPITGSLQAAARKARYALLEAWRAREGALSVMTAHHADDQAETLLMRLNRGAGVSGLAGIRATNGHVLRPLLGWRRTELEAIAAAAGIVPLADPSNQDPRFDRVRMRRALAAADWIDVPALARSASHLADAAEALDWATARLLPEHLVADGTALLLDPGDLPEELVRRLLFAAVVKLDPAIRASGPDLDRVLSALRDGGRTSLGVLLLTGGPRWHIAAAPPRRTGG